VRRSHVSKDAPPGALKTQAKMEAAFAPGWITSGATMSHLRTYALWRRTVGLRRNSREPGSSRGRRFMRFAGRLGVRKPHRRASGRSRYRLPWRDGDRRNLATQISAGAIQTVTVGCGGGPGEAAQGGAAGGSGRWELPNGLRDRSRGQLSGGRALTRAADRTLA